VGLDESALFVARALERLGHAAVDSIAGETEPALAALDIAAPEGKIPKGRVAGVHQTCRVTLKDGCVILLDITIAAGAGAPGDAVEVDGDPPVRFDVQGGVAGDVATASALLNAVSHALQAPPGIARE
jgi:4-hydroxy-tetrahydrodipicolinate reductase